MAIWWKYFQISAVGQSEAGEGDTLQPKGQTTKMHSAKKYILRKTSVGTKGVLNMHICKIIEKTAKDQNLISMAHMELPWP